MIHPVVHMNLNHYLHIHVCPSMCLLVALQRYITLIAPEAPSALSRVLPNLECLRAVDDVLVFIKAFLIKFESKIF